MSLLLISPKNVYATRRLVEEAGNFGVPITTMDVKELAAMDFQIKIDAYNAMFIRFAYPYFNQTIQLARSFQEAGKKVADAAIADGDLGLGKWEMYKKLELAGVPIPRTVMFSPSPLTLSSHPFILKWIYGFKSRGVFLANSQGDVERVLNKFPASEIMAQEFVRARYEYKVMTVGYRSLPVVVKFKILDSRFRINLHNYEVADAQSVPKIAGLAELAAQALGRELAKVDILEDYEGNLYILEVNRWPGFKSFEKLTGYNVAASFIGHLQYQGDPALASCRI